MRTLGRGGARSGALPSLRAVPQLWLTSQTRRTMVTRAAARLAIANAQAAAMAATEGAHSSTNGGTGRVGALSPIPGLIGLQSGQPLHKPVLQPAGPIGEATLDELRTRSAPSSLVTKRMKADMQAFKAANPGCVLEDFVRWYSPSDWLSQSAEGGDNLSGRERLSERFCRDGGLVEHTLGCYAPCSSGTTAPTFRRSTRGK